MLDEILSKKEEIKKILNHSDVFLKTLTSEELFQVVEAFANDPEIRPIIEQNSVSIINRCTTDFDMFNYFTLLSLKFNHINKDYCDKQLHETVNAIFSKNSRIFLMKTLKTMQKNGNFNKEFVFDDILDSLKKHNTKDSSVILFDLYIFPDFKLMMNNKHRVISTLIEGYQLYDPDVMSSQIFNGSTIIGKLLNGDNEEKVAGHLRELLEEKQISTRNVQMVGGGGASLVYKVKNLVIKLGENRNDRKIYINHRILASLKRKLETNEFGEAQFYVEVMKFVRTDGITKEERNELKKDLYEQGLVWTDDKVINCGLLDDDDENISPLPVDYIEVAGNIKYPNRRDEFMKRKRKVVVIDNDHISYNPLKSSG